MSPETAKPASQARLAELTTLDVSNVTGLLVVGALGLLIALNMGFGNLTVSVS